MTNTQRYLNSKPVIDFTLYTTEEGRKRLLATKPRVIRIDNNFKLRQLKKEK